VTNARELIRTARAACDVGRPEEGLRLAARAAASAPQDSWVLSNLAWIQQLTERWDASVETAERAIAANPEGEWGHRLRGVGLYRVGRLDAAVHALAEARRHGPTEVLTHSVFAQYAVYAGRTDEALQAGQQAVDLAPDNTWSWFALGWSHLALNHWDEAELALEKSRDLDPTSSNAHNNLGLVYLRSGRIEQALACFKRALNLDARSSYAFLNAASALRRLGHWEEADDLRVRFRVHQLDTAERLAKQAPTAFTWTSLGLARKNLGQLEAAKADFDVALSLARDRDERTQPLRAAAWAALLVGDDEAARAASESIIDEHPSEPASLSYVTSIGALTGGVDLARRAGQLATAVDTNRVTAAKIQADQSLAAQQWEQAVKEFEALIQLRLQRACCEHASLAIARWHAGDNDGARAALEEAAFTDTACDTLAIIATRDLIPIAKLLSPIACGYVSPAA
jgi:tetratricopeptide (TPR) repeat protein